MRLILITAFLLFAWHTSPAQEQKAAAYFESIRDNGAKLTAFLHQMPKGGDLHHHYSGSVYAETFLDFVIQKDYFLNRSTLEVREMPQYGMDWSRFSGLEPKNELPRFRQRLLEKWSVKDYNHVSYPSDKQFFETFGAFGLATDSTTRQGLLELKNRALNENVSYIETMFSSIPCGVAIPQLPAWNARLRNLDKTRNEQETLRVLDSMYNLLDVAGLRKCASGFVSNTIRRYHEELGIDDDRFTMRYQAYVNRGKDPAILFRDLITAFESVKTSPLMVGVNIVAPEDGEVSMRDYWLHMMMFRYCGTKYDSVKYSMHAGELVLGMVKPEELTWHIDAAIRLAGAARIGHGVDIPWERKAWDLLDLMAGRPVPVEINLTSNEFILKVKEGDHPISLYREHKVPIVISTDDAGVLRSNLTRQFVLLATRYRDIGYAEMKQYIYNSIRYSFIREPALKKRLEKDLDERFRKFEASF